MAGGRGLAALDRLLTIVVTATLTSAVWIVAGATIMDRARIASGAGSTQPVMANAIPGRASGTAADVSVAGAVARTVAVPPSGLRIPVTGVQPSMLVDTFAQARSGGERVHDAIDIAAPAGTGVVAAAPGTVEKLFDSEQGGKTVYIRSSDRVTMYYYAHLQDYAPGLAEQQVVRQGQVIGTVGSTGNASPDAPHLHFAVMATTPDAKWWESTKAINPYSLLTAK